MITSCRIKGFKGLRDLEIPCLSRVTLLGGRNNVGKTSVIEALFMFLDRTNPQMVSRQYGMRGVSTLPLMPEEVFFPIFADYDPSSEITISVEIDGRCESMTIRYNPGYSDYAVQALSTSVDSSGAPVIQTGETATPVGALDICYRQLGQPDQSSHMVVSQNGIALNGDFLKSVVPGAIIPARLRVEANQLAARFGQLDIKCKENELVKFLSIIEPRLKSLSTVATGGVPLIYGDIGLGRKIPVAYMGDGMSHLLQIMLFVATSEGGLVVIDEVENGLHYSVMPKIWQAIGEACTEFNCQVIATTHIYDCLRAAYEGMSGDLSSDFGYVRLDRVDDQVRAKCYEHALLGTALSAEMEVR